MDIPIVKTVEDFEQAYGRSEVVMDSIFGEWYSAAFPTFC
jgi:hypothetical protein